MKPPCAMNRGKKAAAGFAALALIWTPPPGAASAQNVVLPRAAAQVRGMAPIAALPAAARLELARNLNALLLRLSKAQGPSLDPKGLVETIVGHAAGPGREPAQTAAGYALLTALADPKTQEQMIADLRNLNTHGKIGRQTAETLAGFTADYAAPATRTAIMKAAAQALAQSRLNLPASLAALFDGFGSLGHEDMEEARPPVVAGAGAEETVHGSGLLPSDNPAAPEETTDDEAADNATARMGFELFLKQHYGQNHDILQVARGVFRDLTEIDARPFAGRSKQAADLLAVLSRRDVQKTSVLLTGPLGIGRTALIENVASGIKAGTYELDMKFLELDLPELAGLYPQASPAPDADPPFEAFFNTVLPALSRDTVIVIRGADKLLAEGGNRILQRLEKPIERFGQRFIFVLESAAALPTDHFLRKFSETIELGQPDDKEAMQMLLAHKTRWEASSGVSILDSAVEELVRVAKNFLHALHPQELADNMVRAINARSSISQRNAAQAAIRDLYSQLSLAMAKYRRTDSPKDYNEVLDLAQKLMDEQARLKSPGAREVSSQYVRELLAELYPGKANLILNNKDYKKRLLDAISKLPTRVIGQPEAVERVSATLKKIAAGMEADKGPLGSFLFLGPTGVGKTETARALAEAYSGDEEALVRIDMTEYMEKFTVSRLTGPPPGYAGYDAGGQLTEAVFNQPESVTLYDEIEKADPEVFNVLLQVLDDARLTDGKGKTVDFRRTIAVMTSNLASGLIAEMQAAGANWEEIDAAVKKELKLHFRPEFLNRINTIVIFNPLSKAHILDIGKLMADKLVAKPLARGGNHLSFLSEKVLNYVADHGGFDPEYGARPMKRAIDQLITDPVTDHVLAPHEGNLNVSVDMKDGKIAVASRPKVEPAVEKKNLPDGKLGAWLRHILDADTAASPEALKASYEAFFAKPRRMPAAEDETAGGKAPKPKSFPRIDVLDERKMGVSARFIKVKPGSFRMSDQKVTLPHPFELQADDLTQQQALLLLGRNPSYFTSAQDSDGDHAVIGGQGHNLKHPVENISWYEGVEAANALSKLQGLKPCYEIVKDNGKPTGVRITAASGNAYDCEGYRHATAAELEYASRAGNDSAFPLYGKALDESAWHDSRTHAVGTTKPNSWGFYNLVGNVWKWTHNRPEELIGATATDSEDPAANSKRVLFGASFKSKPDTLVGPSTDEGDPRNHGRYVGVRLARSIVP